MGIIGVVAALTILNLIAKNQKRLVETRLKSTYSIFEELSKEWQNMSNAEKQSIAIQYAGKNQFEVFMAEMNQFTSVQKAYNLAVNDNSMATKENEKYMESLTAKLTALKQQFQELALGDGGLSYLLKLLITELKRPWSKICILLFLPSITNMKSCFQMNLVIMMISMCRLLSSLIF